MTHHLFDNIEFNLPLAAETSFPKAELKATPDFKWQNLSLLANQYGFSKATFTQSGRAALALAGEKLKHANQDNTILIPSYHCPAAVEPFIWLNYKVVFFNINLDLKPDMGHIKALIDKNNITHCLLINYFGFNFFEDQLKQLMQTHNICVISDCAHSLFGLINSITQPEPIIKATICSINKMLPTIDGGLVFSPEFTISPAKPYSFWEELKAIAYTLRIVDFANKFRPKKQKHTTEQITRQSPNEFRYFSPTNLKTPCFSHTASILSHSKLDLIAKKRKDNFTYLYQNLVDSKLGQCILHPCDSEDVPYIFPFLINHIDTFSRLRTANIQCLRWEEVAKSECKITQHYRRHLIQLPCHQTLSKDELDKIIRYLA